LASLLAFDRCSGGGTDIDDALLSGGLALADEGSFRLIVSRDVSHMLHLLRAGFVNRVDTAMSALLSAVYNTGHYHVQRRLVCVLSSCIRSTNNAQNRRSSDDLASMDLTTLDARAVSKDSTHRMEKHARNLLTGRVAWFFV
jgi:hypothetical protein